MGLLREISILVALATSYVYGGVERSVHNFQVGGGVIQPVTIDMVNEFFRRELSSEEPLHDNTVFGFVFSVSYIDKTVSVFDVVTFEGLFSRWAPVPSPKGIVGRAHLFGEDRSTTSRNDAPISRKILLDSLDGIRVSGFLPSFIVHKAVTTCYSWSIAILNWACFHVIIIRQEVPNGKW